MLNLICVTIFGDEKTVVVRITDPKGCAHALGACLDGDLLADITEFAEDVLSSNPDAGVVELSPENVASVLKSAAAENAAAETASPVVEPIAATAAADSSSPIEEPVPAEAKP